MAGAKDTEQHFIYMKANKNKLEGLGRTIYLLDGLLKDVFIMRPRRMIFPANITYLKADSKQ